MDVEGRERKGREGKGRAGRQATQQQHNLKTLGAADRWREAADADWFSHNPVLLTHWSTEGEQENGAGKAPLGRFLLFTSGSSSKL
ncbi:hypothetical protein Pmani_016924 [Petrolisthes manimaculis]|uniref:Uncharacterized protein n=1 Tax=Petrolisthes manimaculis TaxID=1843537 RepID=A0AAE1PP17_9EUCA|nr:hypothetical protein Pmani_016924 [Petrolisthes manimaculis]